MLSFQEPLGPVSINEKGEAVSVGMSEGSKGRESGGFKGLSKQVRERQMAKSGGTTAGPGARTEVESGKECSNSSWG